MSARRTVLTAGIAVLAFAAVLLAAFLGGEGSTRAGRTPANAAWGAELDRLARSQERTAAALERLEEILTERLDVPTLEASARRAVGSAPAAETFDQLIASLDALRATLEAESRRTQELIRRAPAFGGESLREVHDRSPGPDWGALGELERGWRADEREANRSQYLQTARDLLEAYGPPTAIYRPKDGLLFVYRRHAEGQSGPAWYFRLQDGMVVEFHLEDEQADGESR